MRTRSPGLLALVMLFACSGEDSASTRAPDAACGLDCTAPRPDAPRPDAGLDAPAIPLGSDVVEVTLESAALPADAEALAAVALDEGQASQPGAVGLETVTGDVLARSAAPSAVSLPGLEGAVALRWGFILQARTSSGSWLDRSGFIAVSDGTIELVRALRWDGSGEPGDARPTSFVAPQTDPRVVRFRSFIGAGSDGLLFRVRRPVVKPVVLVVEIGGQRRVYPLEETLNDRSRSGGYVGLEGEIDLDTYTPTVTAGCYVNRGISSQGTWTYQPSTNFVDAGELHIMRPGGVEAILHITGGENRGPYGLFTGSLDGSSATVQGYVGASYILDRLDHRGTFTGVVTASGGTVQEFLAGDYDGDGITGAQLFQRAACDQPGASPRNYFIY